MPSKYALSFGRSRTLLRQRRDSGELNAQPDADAADAHRRVDERAHRRGQGLRRLGDERAAARQCRSRQEEPGYDSAADARTVGETAVRGAVNVRWRTAARGCPPHAMTSPSRIAAD